MKTPKRKFWFPMDDLNGLGTRLAFEGEDVPTAHSLQCSRWKRKNKYRQYKRTIKHLRAEIKYRDMQLDYIGERNKEIRAQNEQLMHDRLVLHIRIAKLQRELRKYEPDET